MLCLRTTGRANAESEESCSTGVNTKLSDLPQAHRKSQRATCTVSSDLIFKSIRKYSKFGSPFNLLVLVQVHVVAVVRVAFVLVTVRLKVNLSDFVLVTVSMA